MNNLVKRTLLLLMACLCLLNFQRMPLVSAESIEQKETLYIALFFVYSGDVRLAKNTEILIENSTIGPPINKNLEAFNNGFIKARFHLAPLGYEFSVVLNAFFDPSIGNETASSYADEIAEEFLKVFGYQNFKPFTNLNWQGLEESKIRVYRAFGHGKYNKEEIANFLKYAPPSGFSRFINGLIEKYVPGDPVTGLDLPCYTIKKIGADFYWDFEVYTTTNEPLPKNAEYSESISVNELLNNKPPLVNNSSENQRIIILIMQNRTVQLSGELRTYRTNFQIRPEGYTIGNYEDWPNTIKIEYASPSMEDIVIDLKIDSIAQPRPIPMGILIAAVGAIICGIALVVLIVYAKKKQKEGEGNVR